MGLCARECIFTNCVPLRNSMSSLIWRLLLRPFVFSGQQIISRGTTCTRVFSPTRRGHFLRKHPFRPWRRVAVFFNVKWGAICVGVARVQLAKGGTIASGLSATTGPCCDKFGPSPPRSQSKSPFAAPVTSACFRVILYLKLPLVRYSCV